MERGKEKLLEVLDAESRRPRRQGASDVELRDRGSRFHSVRREGSEDDERVSVIWSP
jgi:hypothetical protein